MVWAVKDLNPTGEEQLLHIPQITCYIKAATNL